MSAKQLKSAVLLLALAHLAAVQIGPCAAQQVDPNFYARPGVTAAEIIRARGFVAEEHHIATTDGYCLLITRAFHPTLNGGNGGLPNLEPMVFFHGILEDPVVFVINSFGVVPKNLTGYDLESNPNGLASEPSAKSLCFLGMNMGRECWLLSRRGAPGSQSKNCSSTQPSGRSTRAAPPSFGLPSLPLLPVSPSSYGGRFSPQTFSTAPAAFADYGRLAEDAAISADKDFWNFTMDPQAKYDIPQSIYYVLTVTGQTKVAIVAHSNGGALTLMALSLYPELADNVTTAVLWSHGFSLGHGDNFDVLVPLEGFLTSYIGPVPPTYSTPQIQAFLGLFCATGLTQRTLCETVADIALGPSAGQEPIYPEFLNSLLFPTASLELAQILQNVRLNGTEHLFDYGPETNLRLYGQPTPPPYNASDIRLPNMSFYVGPTDTLVSPADVTFVLPSLTVPYKFTLIDDVFNHQGYFYHDDNAILVIIPSMLDIRRAP